MAIQIPNPGTGNGATGDNEFVLWTKTANNFNLLKDAAFKSIGINTGQIPTADLAYKATYTQTLAVIQPDGSTVPDFNSLEEGSLRIVRGTCANAPRVTSEYWYVETVRGYSGTKVQYAKPFNATGSYSRIWLAASWSPWVASSQNTSNYETTTASGANVFVDTTGKLMRSTSSERYKDILAPLELDDARYADAMALKPIVYRSTANADNPAYHYYSFSAEELGAYDPAFTLWRETETVTDADGNVIEQPLAERQAEGININALLAMSHAIAIKQDKLIKALEARIEILEAK